MKIRFMTLVCILAVLFAEVPQSIAMEDGSTEAVAADILLVRPACFVMTVVGSALFLVALPVAAATHSTKQTANALVVKPAKATFSRGIGDMTDLTGD